MNKDIGLLIFVLIVLFLLSQRKGLAVAAQNEERIQMMRDENGRLQEIVIHRTVER